MVGNTFVAYFCGPLSSPVDCGPTCASQDNRRALSQGGEEGGGHKLTAAEATAHCPLPSVFCLLFLLHTFGKKFASFRVAKTRPNSDAATTTTMVDNIEGNNMK